MKEKSLAILVLSCDKYADMWAPFLQQFRKYFPHSNYSIYFGSNTISCGEPGVIPVLSGDDPDWSTSLKNILAQINEEKLFVILEDQFLASPMDTQGFQTALSFLLEKDARHIKFWAFAGFIDSTDNSKIGLYPKGAPYRSTVCGFWDRKYLMNLLIEGENPWNFEILGSYRTSYSDGFYGLTQPLFVFRNMIEKGCWIPESVAWALAEGMVLQLDKRPLLKGGKQILSRVKMLYFDLMLLVPWRWRVTLMNKLRRAFVSY